MGLYLGPINRLSSPRPNRLLQKPKALLRNLDGSRASHRRKQISVFMGISYLPISTSSLLLSSQLAFNLFLSVLLVNQKMHFTNINCILLLTHSSVLLGLGSSHHQPEIVSKTHFFLDFFSILGTTTLFTRYLLLMEMAYKGGGVVQNGGGDECFDRHGRELVLDGRDGFEGRVRGDEEGGEVGRRSWVTVGFNLVSWQMCFMGTVGVVFFYDIIDGRDLHGVGAAEEEADDEGGGAAEERFRGGRREVLMFPEEKTRERREDLSTSAFL